MRAIRSQAQSNLLSINLEESLEGSVVALVAIGLDGH